MAHLTTVYTRAELQDRYLHTVVKQVVDEVLSAASVGRLYTTIQNGHQVAPGFTERLEQEIRRVLIDCTILITRNNHMYTVQVDWSPPLRNPPLTPNHEY